MSETRVTTGSTVSRMRFDSREWSNVFHYSVLSAILLAGAYLRLTDLRRQSLWFDEVDVVVRAQQPMSQVLRTFVATGENGPLYNLLLAIWIRMAGISEIAVRFPSAVAGVLAIPLLYVLGRRLVNAQTGLVAAFLLAISPYHIWYSQEAKMYTIAVLLALASTYALVEALLSNRIAWWIIYVACTTLLFYTHVATVLVFAAQCLYVGLTRNTWRGREKPWLASVAALTLPYVPIALWAVRVVGGRVSTWQPDVGLWDALRIFATRFAINRYDMPIQERAAILYVALAVVGAIVLSRVERHRRWWLLLTLLSTVPVVGLWLVSVRQSVFSDRYGIVALPAYLLLVATALAWLVRHRRAWPVGVIGLFLVLSVAWAPIRDVNRTHTAQKEDWRSAYAWIADHAEPGDAIIVHPGYLITTLTYFEQREPRLAQYPVATIPTFRVRWLDEPLMIQMIADQIGHPPRIWLVQSPDRVPLDDPDAILEGWLDRDAQRVDDLVVNGVDVTLYDMPGTGSAR